MAKEIAIVLSNGSINSAVTTGLAAQKYRPVLLHVEPATTGGRGRVVYDQQVGHFKPYREHVLAMPFLTTVHQANPGGNDPRAASLGGKLLELLPMVAVAARFAVHYQAAAVCLGLRVGAHGEELSQATEYVQIWNEMLNLPCAQAELEILTPLLELDAWQVVDVGFQVAVPFEKTWSCLEEGSEPCWACRGCRGREAAFQQAGKPDPLRAVRKV